MYDSGKILLGVVIFLVLVTFPWWYNVAKGKAGPAPELEKPATAQNCVLDTKEMLARHMDLLNSWRNKVVREGKRIYTNPKGVSFEMSLTKTCLKCHEQKDKFCDRCHTYMGVEPYCWDCHVAPKEVGR